MSTVAFEIQQSGQSCGASVRGLDLRDSLSAETIGALRQAWLTHHVLAFPDQDLSDDDLERFTGYFGGFGDDPFIAPIAGREHVIAISRRADEKAPLFAENWHSDWSFQARPPAGTCLYGKVIPPVGGDTLFANQHAAFEALPALEQTKYQRLTAIHSAAGAYAPDGAYGEADQATDRSMTIRPSAEARATHTHPLVRAHPETGRLAFFSTLGYIVGIEGMAQEEAIPLLRELAQWQGQEAFQYRHRWAAGTLVMWDNRSVLHCATGGYEGHDRLLHRTTIAAYEATRHEIA